MKVLMVSRFRSMNMQFRCFAVVQSTMMNTAKNSVVSLRLCLKTMMSRYTFYTMSTGASTCRWGSPNGFIP